MANKIFVYIDHFNGQALPASWEAVGVARTLADQFSSVVTAVVLGCEVEGLANLSIEYGADRVLMGDDPELKDYRPEPFYQQDPRVGGYGGCRS